jgi:hypothetical protein
MDLQDTHLGHVKGMRLVSVTSMAGYVLSGCLIVGKMVKRHGFGDVRPCLLQILLTKERMCLTQEHEAVPLQVDRRINQWKACYACVWPPEVCNVGPADANESGLKIRYHVLAVPTVRFQAIVAKGAQVWSSVGLVEGSLCSLPLVITKISACAVFCS